MSRPLDAVDVLAEHHDLHLTLDQPGGLKRWRLGVIRPWGAVRAGARPFRSFEGMPDLHDDQVQAAASRLLLTLAKAPPSRGS